MLKIDALTMLNDFECLDCDIALRRQSEADHVQHLRRYYGLSNRKIKPDLKRQKCELCALQTYFGNSFRNYAKINETMDNGQ